MEINVRFFVVVILLLFGCSNPPAPPPVPLEQQPCFESATLISTAAGSPSQTTCGDSRRQVLELGTPTAAGSNGFVSVVCRCLPSPKGTP
jgi:hypothetical protein